MRSFRWCNLGLLACLAMLLVGCGNLGALFYFLSPSQGDPPPVELVKGRKKKSIAYLVYVNNGLKFTFDDLDSQLAGRLATQTKLTDKRFVVKPDREVREWKDKNPQWLEMNLQKIGEALDVDFVYFVEIKRFSLNETKSQLLLQGATDMVVKIHDVEEDVLRYDNTYHREFHRTDKCRSQKCSRKMSSRASSC